MAWIDVVGRVRFWTILALTIMTSLLPEAASACIAPDFQRTVFYEKEDIPSDDVAPTVADVTIVFKSTLPDGRVALIARVNKTLRGQIAGWSIRIVTFQSSCDAVPTAGARGVVAGRMIHDEQGALQFQAIIESLGERERRRQPAAAPSGRMS